MLHSRTEGARLRVDFISSRWGIMFRSTLLPVAIIEILVGSKDGIRIFSP